MNSSRSLATVYPNLVRADIELLHRSFGHTRFVYLRRDDVLPQAVSWLLAGRTGVWFETNQSRPKRPEHKPRFAFDEIQELVTMVEQHNARGRHGSLRLVLSLTRFDTKTSSPTRSASPAPSLPSSSWRYPTGATSCRMRDRMSPARSSPEALSEKRPPQHGGDQPALSPRWATTTFGSRISSA